MTALLAWVFRAVIGNKAIMALFAAVVSGLGLYVAGGVNRAKKEAAKQAAGKLAAAEDRLEMDREATEAERQAAGLTDDAARKEAEKWARR
ncbi:hypothetical protein NKH73_14255 [Mesorhizobium sp. M0938]|uniref:hypothetical protein n=1 Tax=unclassified Mesorhizobium TaxID=325217 RepID=UPI00333C0FB0